MRVFTSDEFELEFFGSSRAIKVPSKAELGHFNFQAETEPDLFLCIPFLAQNNFFSSFYQYLNQKISHFKKKKVLLTTIKTEKTEFF
jgi:hypothetical protein